MHIIQSWSSVELRQAVSQQLRRAAARGLVSVVATLTTAAVFAPSAARAVDAAAESAAGSSLAEIVVTATRREEKLKDVPVSASVLSGEPLAAIGAAGDDIRQLAFRVPSLNIESSNGRTFPRFYIRGYGNTDFNSFASQPVSLVYDDVVQENPSLKGFPVFDQADVEVLRGPQGTLFGRNSPAGVVKLESAKPVLGQFSGSASISDGTYNTAVVEGVVNLPVNDRIAMRFSTQGQHRDDWVEDPINGAKLEGYDDWAARVQLLYKPDDSFNALFNVHGRTLNGSARLFRANIIELGTNNLVPGFDPSKFYSDGYNGQSYSMAGGSVHLNWNLPGLTIQSITGYESILHYNTIGDIDGGYGFGPSIITGGFGVTPSGPGFIPFPVETGGGIKNHRQVTQEVRGIWTVSSALTAQAGVFLFDEDVEDISHNYSMTGLTIADTTESRQKNDAQAVFGSLEYNVSPAFKLRGGVRYTADHKTFDVPVAVAADGTPLPLTGPLYKAASATNLSWDVSGTYTLTPDVNLYGRVATGFRAPSFGAPTGSQAIQVARSENNISYEAGIKADILEHRARISFDVFYYDVSHQQLTAVGGQANQTSLINAAHTIGQGAELDFEAQVTPNLSVNLSGSYNDTKIKDKTLAVGQCFNWTFAGDPALGDAANAAAATAQCHITNPLDANGNVLIDGNPLPQAAKYIGDISVRYGIPLGASDEIYAYTDWSYRSKIDFFLYQATEFVGQSMVQGGFRLGYSWADKKYDAAVFCRNCTNQIRVIGAIDFENATGMINDPRIVGAQFSAKF